ncbi:MAG: hemolysin family protein [Qingshengfaniella sp.]
MNDSDGSSSAAQSAQLNDENEPKGLWDRLMFWQSGEDADSEPDGPKTGDGAANGWTRPGLFNLRQMRVEDVAIPKGEIHAVPVDIPLKDLVDVFRDSGFTRLPVYEGTLDMPLGMVHLKDVALNYGFDGRHGAFDLRGLVRPLLFAPPSMPIGVLLQKMQSQRMHMALVIDEYGGTDGLVTIEDLIEQVIGEIEDEHDVDEVSLWTEETPGAYIVSARAPLADFELQIGHALALPDFEEDVDTIGGLVFLLTGRVPARGEIVRHPDGTEIEVVDADPRRIKRLRVRLPKEAGSDPAT